MIDRALDTFTMLPMRSKCFCCIFSLESYHNKTRDGGRRCAANFPDIFIKRLMQLYLTKKLKVRKYSRPLNPYLLHTANWQVCHFVYAKREDQLVKKSIWTILEQTGCKMYILCNFMATLSIGIHYDVPFRSFWKILPKNGHRFCIIFLKKRSF